MATSRKIASKSVRPEPMAAAGDAEVVAVKRGMGWEGGVAIITTIVLIVAILCVDKDLGAKYGQGMFFK